MMIKKNQAGQALLIVVLSLSVVLIIVLFIVSRSITDITVSVKDEDALRAFSAAEAGIEKALLTGASTGELSLGDASFDASVSSFAEGQQEVVYPFKLTSGEEGTFWFVGHDEDGFLTCTGVTCFSGSSMRIAWGDKNTNGDQDESPAIEVTVYYLTTPGDFSTIRTAQFVVDPNDVRRVTNNFSADAGVGYTVSGEEFAFTKTMNFSDIGISNSTTANILQFIKVKLLYNTSAGHKIALSVSGDVTNTLLPSQGTVVDSLGQYNQANRRISVYRLFPEIPAIFDYALFTKTDIVK